MVGYFSWLHSSTFPQVLGYMIVLNGQFYDKSKKVIILKILLFLSSKDGNGASSSVHFGF